MTPDDGYDGARAGIARPDAPDTNASRGTVGTGVDAPRRHRQGPGRPGCADPLSRSVAFQLTSRCPRASWKAVTCGSDRRPHASEISCLRQRAGLPERRIATALPKLSAVQIVEFLDELTKPIGGSRARFSTRRSTPLIHSRPAARYLAEYRLVARQLRAIDPTMARTVADATFTAVVPLSKAREHMQRFSSLLTKHQETPELARMIARACYRAK